MSCLICALVFFKKEKKWWLDTVGNIECDRLMDIQILLSWNLGNNTNVSWACCLQPNNIKSTFYLKKKIEMVQKFIFRVTTRKKKKKKANLETADTTTLIWLTEETKCNASVVKSLCCGPLWVICFHHTFTCALLYTILPPHARGSWPLKKILMICIMCIRSRIELSL